MIYYADDGPMDSTLQIVFRQLRGTHVFLESNRGGVCGRPWTSGAMFAFFLSSFFHSYLLLHQVWKTLGLQEFSDMIPFLSHSSFSIAAGQRYLSQESHRVIGCPPKHVISADASSSGQAGSGTKEPKAQTKRKAFGPGVDIICQAKPKTPGE